ncbi:ead/Ea22-like family protein [Klebsiella pneumoniae]
MTTDITELAQREKFEAWVITQICISKSTLEGLRTSDGYRNSTLSGRDYNLMWNLWKAAGAELVEALEKAQQRNAELEAQNEYIRKRYQQLDLLIGKNILVMQAAIIEWQATGDAKNGLAWIYNTLFGPGELPDEAEKDAQAYFDRKYAPLDEELMALHKWFWEQSEAERAAAGIKVEAE